MAGSRVELVRVPDDDLPLFLPLVRDDWTTQQRSPARARAAGLPATPLEVTAADVLAWDRARGEPPLTAGFTPEEERARLARRGRRGERSSPSHPGASTYDWELGT
ncbi:hypothetical protein ACGFSD_14040 [Streptomyces caniferus]|uniref:hypothetical protein n=1 Tax=Streptomyces caniferus TaxID=285557 RepID=UPI003711C4DE